MGIRLCTPLTVKDTDAKKKPDTSDQKGTGNQKSMTANVTVEKSKGGGEGGGEVVHDVMISYSHKDMKTMHNVLELLQNNGYSVWTDRKLQGGQQFLTTIGKAVLESKVFLPLLSNEYIASTVCKDEQALAYLSGKSILPLALVTREQLETSMDLGMRLQMARFKWHVISEENFQTTMDEFLVDLRHSLHEVMSQKCSDVTEEVDEDTKFWECHFWNTDSVSWDKFWGAFLGEYRQRIVTCYGHGMETRLSLILVRELDVITTKDVVLKGVYTEFCKMGGQRVSLWKRLQGQVAEDLAGWEVLEMDSSVRVAFIEHLGKVQSKRAVEILLDLIDGEDADMRATAALSLAKTGDNSERVINKLLLCLESEDRLVRESGCLALGHLRAEQAVPKLIQLWRNDVISTVREACQLSLRLVGGEAAERAIYVTNLLSQEIRDLTQDATN